MRLTCCALGLALLVAACDDGGETSSDVVASDATDADVTDTFFPPVEGTDPVQPGRVLLRAGGLQRGALSRTRVRVPDPEMPDDEDLNYTVYVSTCVPEAGCVDNVDCARICNPSLEFALEACGARVEGAGSLSCSDELPCASGECRTESVGAICVDAVPCAENGHCSSASRCLFDPNQRDEVTGLPTALGACSDGEPNSPCYEDADCRYMRCEGQRCSTGEVGSTCASNVQCASDICRISDGAESGQCSAGETGDQCFGDGDCAGALRCKSNVCADDGEGSRCAEAAECASGICVSGLCRSGVLGAACAEPTDCAEGYCAGGHCRTGELGAYCSDDSQCGAGLVCGRNTCTDGAVGSSCISADQCTQAFACLDRVCVGGNPGDPCTTGSHCRSGLCDEAPGVTAERCIVLEAGRNCSTDQQCASGVCDMTTRTCN